jgi:hypothetical protein
MLTSFYTIWIEPVPVEDLVGLKPKFLALMKTVYFSCMKTNQKKLTVFLTDGQLRFHHMKPRLKKFGSGRIH